MWSRLKTIILVLLGAGIVGLIIVNAVVTKPTPSYTVWSEAMTMGNKEAEHHFTVYTDIYCPYCDNYSRALEENLDEFQRDYIDSGKVFYEIRLTDMIADHSPNSERGGESGYCAADQNKFWDYYHGILSQLKDDYHSKGIGTSKTSPEIPKLDDDYYIDVARKVDGLDVAAFTDCLTDHKMLDTLNQNTTKAAQTISSGLPYFVFDEWTSSGFEGDWKTIKSMFRAGGV
jgi:protein-disulfide isomerase